MELRARLIALWPRGGYGSMRDLREENGGPHSLIEKVYAPSMRPLSLQELAIGRHVLCGSDF